MTVTTSQRKGNTMGCDIHLFVERIEEKAGEPGTWVAADVFEPVPDDWIEDPNDPNERRIHVPYQALFYHERNYNMFAILANVRNGRGFAGVDTGDGFVPISEPRGLPFNVSPEVKADSEHWGVDGHSHSFFTVAELMAYDWTQVTTSRGTVDALTFWSWCNWGRDQGDPPRGYSGGVWGEKIEHVEPDVLEARIKALIEANTTKDERPDMDRVEELIRANFEQTFTRVEWPTPYYKAGTYFLGTVLPRLWRLGPPDKVRIVFWFDN